MPGRLSGLRGQLQTQPLEQQLLLGLRLSVTAQDQGAPIGCRQMNMDHLDGGEILQDGAGGCARGPGGATGSSA